MAKKQPSKSDIYPFYTESSFIVDRIWVADKKEKGFDGIVWAGTRGEMLDQTTLHIEVFSPHDELIVEYDRDVTGLPEFKKEVNTELFRYAKKLVEKDLEREFKAKIVEKIAELL
jgi:hypothetical protein